MSDAAARMQLSALLDWLQSVTVPTLSKVILTDSTGKAKVPLDSSWVIGPAVKISTTVYVAIASQTTPLLPADFTQRVIDARDS